MELVDTLAAALAVALPVLIIQVTFSTSISYQLETFNADTPSLVVSSRLSIQTRAAQAGIADVLEAVLAHAASGLVSHSVGFEKLANNALSKIVFGVAVDAVTPSLAIWLKEDVEIVARLAQFGLLSVVKEVRVALAHTFSVSFGVDIEVVAGSAFVGSKLVAGAALAASFLVSNVE